VTGFVVVVAGLVVVLVVRVVVVVVTGLVVVVVVTAESGSGSIHTSFEALGVSCIWVLSPDTGTPSA
jgi:hypothetical protein